MSSRLGEFVKNPISTIKTIQHARKVLKDNRELIEGIVHYIKLDQKTAEKIEKNVNGLYESGYLFSVEKNADSLRENLWRTSLKELGTTNIDRILAMGNGRVEFASEGRTYFAEIKGNKIDVYRAEGKPEVFERAKQDLGDIFVNAASINKNVELRIDPTPATNTILGIILSDPHKVGGKDFAYINIRTLGCSSFSIHIDLIGQFGWESGYAPNLFGPKEVSKKLASFVTNIANLAKGEYGMYRIEYGHSSD